MTATQMPMFVAIVLVLACLLAMLRWWRQPPAGPTWRLACVLLLQPALAALLYFGLFPPVRTTQGNARLVVLTADWRSATTHLPDGLRIALPEAQPSQGVERTPDLATALRRHPQVTQLALLGRGLVPRDVQAAQAYALTFQPAPLPAGLVELSFPPRTSAGNSVRVQGRIHGLPGAAVALLDPANQRMQRTSLAVDGRFSLQADMRAAGQTLLTLQVLNANGGLHEALPIPIDVITAPPLRLLVRAGAANPELKYLRRWAKDAGIALHTQIDAGSGIFLGDAPVALDAAHLQAFDAVYLDTRSVLALHEAELRALTSAITQGLGVLVQLDAAPSPALRARLRAWGLSLDHSEAVPDAQLAAASTQLLAYRLPNATADSVPFLRDIRGHVFGHWHALQRGRVGVLTLLETYPLALDGHATQHAQLWSSIFATLARAQDATEATLPALISPPYWLGDRITICGLIDPASSRAADMKASPVLIDPQTGDRHCGAFWPQQPGWHWLTQAHTHTAFFVMPATTAVAWRAAQRRQATQQLAIAATRASTGKLPTHTQRGAAWPWLAAWLVLAVLGWLCERRWRKP